MIRLLKHLKDTNIPINELTSKFTKIYNEDMAMLGVDLPDLSNQKLRITLRK